MKNEKQKPNDSDFPEIILGPQTPPNHPWIFNKPDEHGEYPPINQFFDKTLEIIEADSSYDQ